MSLDEVERGDLTAKHLHQHERDSLHGLNGSTAQFAYQTFAVHRPNLVECHLATAALER